MDKIIFEGILEFQKEDGGCSKYAFLSDNVSLEDDGRLYVELGSYDDSYEKYIREGGNANDLETLREYRAIHRDYIPEHLLCDKLEGKKVRVTIEVLE